jgi:histone H3/H4
VNVLRNMSGTIHAKRVTIMPKDVQLAAPPPENMGAAG